MNAKPQVLVIDDDAMVGRSFDQVLGPRGYEVDTALSGEVALRRIDEKNYDVVFIDIRMNNRDGLEVAELIRQHCPRTPVVVMAGSDMDVHEARARVPGSDSFVRKPLTPEMIESKTLEALQRENIVEAGAPETTAVAPAVQTPLRSASQVARNVGLFAAAPFIGLAYVIALPFVFFGMSAKLAAEALRNRKSSG